MAWRDGVECLTPRVAFALGLSVCSDPAHGGDGIPGGYECGHGSSCSRICGEDSALALREVLPRDEDQLCSECRVLLLIAYPTKALTNPPFYIKLLLIAAAADR